MRTWLLCLLLMAGVADDARAFQVTVNQQKNILLISAPVPEENHKYSEAWLMIGPRVYDELESLSPNSWRIVVEDYDRTHAVFTVAVCGPNSCHLEEAEFPLEGASVSFFWVVGVALLAGFLMNLMPCVLPVIGLKLRAFGKSGKWSYVLGVLCSFMALATVSLTLGTGISLMGFGIYRATLVVVCIMMSTHLLGMWKMPSFGYSGTVGPFGTGMLTVALGSSCAVPFLAPAMAYTMSCSVVQTYLVFLALGVGFCSPFMVPIPMGHFQKGIGGVWFERLCGLALGAVAGWISLSLSDSILSGTLMLSGGLLLLATLRNFDLEIARLGYVPVTLGALMLWLASTSITTTAITEQTWPTEGPRAIFVTADWCLNCSAMKAMLDDPEVMDALVNDAGIESGFTIVDYTDRSPQVTRNLLVSYAVKGDVPVLVIVTIDGNVTVLTGLWTKASLLSALGHSP